MDCKKRIDEENQTLTQLAVFDSGSGCKEFHIKIQGMNPELNFTEQLTGLLSSYQSLTANELKEAKPVFKRYFLSDAANQAAFIPDTDPSYHECPVSVIGQAPLNGTKIALWVIFQTGVEVCMPENGLCEVNRNGYRYLWGTAVCEGVEGAKAQTRALFDQYIAQLADEGCTLVDNCLRTWFFIDNIDVNYAGMVESRNEVFAEQGLTEKTHSIASTGIYGRTKKPSVVVQMDTYAVAGLLPEQVQYLYAPSHLNSTHEYGVSFERGTAIQYGDRKRVFISGTASIDNRGEIVWPGDIVKQTYRMWENVEVLLQEADCGFEDIVQMIVYIRDPADATVVNNLFEEKFPDIPKVIVLASVCREGWLIEMECIALKAIRDERFREF